MIKETVITIESKRPQGRIEIAPAILMARGRVVRPSPFSTADAVFAGTPAEVARRFLDATTARTFYLFDTDGAAGSPESIAAARAVKALSSGLHVLLEGGLRDVDACLALAKDRILPVADEQLLEVVLRDDGVGEGYLSLGGDGEDVFERVAQALERGFWGVVHHSANPARSCELARRLGGQVPFWSREPSASPDDVERVIDHHRQLFRGGAPAVIVDGEWYVDYNTMNEPFDLLR